MRLLKSETARFIALGFVGGTALVLSVIGFNSDFRKDGTLVPTAQANSAQ